MKKSILAGTAVGSGLIGILLGTPYARDKLVETGRNVISNARQTLSDEWIEFRYGTTEAGVRYRTSQKYISVSATPMELAEGNDLLAKYITIKNGLLNPNQVINPGTTVEILTPDQKGERLGDLVIESYHQAKK